LKWKLKLLKWGRQKGLSKFNSLHAYKLRLLRFCTEWAVEYSILMLCSWYRSRTTFPDFRLELEKDKDLAPELPRIQLKSPSLVTNQSDVINQESLETAVTDQPAAVTVSGWYYRIRTTSTVHVAFLTSASSVCGLVDSIYGYVQIYHFFRLRLRKNMLLILIAVAKKVPM
jgi:hypothetical protein